MIETVLRTYLQEALGCPVWMEVAAAPPKRYIIMSRTGGGRSGRLKTAGILLQSYAESLYDTAQLNEQVEEAMDAAGALPELCRTELSSSGMLTDPSTKRYRYQALYDIIYY